MDSRCGLPCSMSPLTSTTSGARSVNLGARHTVVVRVGAERLLTWLQPPIPLRVVVEDAEYRVGPARDGEGEGEIVVLTTDRFEAFRWRMGRRSRAQLANLQWTGDPTPILDHLVVFGPAPTDIYE
jgi:hypothetical protein